MRLTRFLSPGCRIFVLVASESAISVTECTGRLDKLPRLDVRAREVCAYNAGYD